MTKVLRALVLAIALACAAETTLVRPIAQTPTAHPNILFVTIDTLRADRLGSYGYRLARTPNLDALAAEGVRFGDASSYAPLTYPSHAALLTGRYVSAFGVKANGSTPLPEQAVTIAEDLKKAGYDTAAFVSSAILDRAYGLGQGFDVYDDDFASQSGGATVSLSDLQRPAGEVAGRFRQWADGRQARAGSRPWFAWVHFYDPHLPYEPPAAYATLAPGRPYDGEVAYVDATLGDLLKRLDRRTTFIVVTADHGESLGEHGETDHGFFLYDSTLHVPLIVAGPGLTPRLVNEQVRTVDLAPTIAELAGVRADEPRDGASIVGLARGSSRREVPVAFAEAWYPRLHFGWSELRAARVGEWKYIAAPKPELYDLRTDGVERRNVVNEKATVGARLAADLTKIVASTASPAATATPAAPDPEAARRLQALGYVGSFAPAASGAADVNPADRIQEYQQYRTLFNRAVGALSRGDATTAVSVLKRLAATNVRAFEAHLYLGNAYALQKNYDAALGEYDVALQLNPDLASAEYEAAKVFSARGDVASAIARAKKGLEKEPASVYGHYTLGVIYQKASLWSDAASEFTRAVELNARDGRARANLAQVSLRLGRFAEARTQFEQMITLGFQVAPAQFNLGVLAAREGDTAEAARRYRLALQADPTFAPAREALARLK
jgi:arylsulfatase A-like enzyme/Tfp pilus assembly protein PilF